MPSPFASVTRVALAEIVREHTTDSKFGYFLSEEALTALVDSLVSFMETSRSLKSAGDRIMQQTLAPTPPPAYRGRPKNP